jgi:stage II sporulation protein P
MKRKYSKFRVSRIIRIKFSRILIGIILIILTGYVLATSQSGIFRTWTTCLNRGIVRASGLMYAPLADFQTRELTEQSESSPGRLLFRIVSLICPMGSYTLNQSETSVFLEDPDTQSVILALQEQDENAVDEDGNVTITDTVTEEQKDKTADEGQSESSAQVSLEKLKDFDYLKSHYYTVDSTTSISATELDAETFLNKDMTINIEGTEPKVLIYHTHSQEAFQDSKSGEVSDTIVGVGDYLTSLLEDKYGIPVLHHTGVYDLVDGKLDRSQAYELAKPELTKLLEENPEIEVVIDLHRDGVAQGTRLVTEVNGKQTAKIMFFNGLSRTNSNGNIGYLSNPYIEDNLAFSFQMELKAEALYPDFTRKIYLKSYRYNMHFKPKTLLIEAGAQTNTVEEEMNAMEPLAEILAAVLTP